MMAASTPKQVRQSKLAWSLYICLGFRGSARAFIPDWVQHKQKMLQELDTLILCLRLYLNGSKK